MTCDEARQFYAALIAVELIRLLRVPGGHIAERPADDGIPTDGGSDHRAVGQGGRARTRRIGTQRARALRSTRLDTKARGVCCHCVGAEGGAAASPT